MKLAGVGGGGGGGGQGGGFGRRSGTSQGVGKGATPAVSGLKPLRAGVPCASLLSASPLRVEPTECRAKNDAFHAPGSRVNQVYAIYLTSLTSDRFLRFDRSSVISIIFSIRRNSKRKGKCKLCSTLCVHSSSVKFSVKCVD